MAKVSFGKGEKPVLTKPAELPPAQETLPAVVNNPPPALALGDRIPDFSEIVLPRLNLVQNIGVLCASFIPGSIVYNQQTVLFVPPDIEAATGNVKRAATPPLNLTVLGFRPTRYCEKVSGGARGLIVSSEDEVRRNGGTLDFKEWKLKEKDGMKRFEPLADALVAIERPEAVADDDTIFIYPVNGRKYALALWALRGTSYTAAAKRVFFTARALGCLRSGYPAYGYAISSRQETWQGGNKSWIPVCIPGVKSTPEFLAFTAEVLTGSLTPKSTDAAADAAE